MLPRDGYPAGVPCWIDLMQSDVDATMAFYGDLFGWTFDVRTPDEAPQRYAYALSDGLLVGAVGGPPAAESESAGWNTYIWVDSADDTVALVEAHGGQVLAPPMDIPHAGRAAVCADPAGAVFGLWEAGENRGAQVVNAPGTWNFSDLNVPDPDAAQAFYAPVLGWSWEALEMGGGQKTWMWRVEGYGDFLAERDPEIRSRQESEQAPNGFADAVALMMPINEGAADASPHWGVTFAVADADAAVARAVELGATVVTPLIDTNFTRMGAVRDPQGAVLTLSEYRPPTPA